MYSAALFLVSFFFKQLSLLFAQGQLLQALRPQDFQKGWGWGESPCLPGAASPILLPAGDGRVDKVCPCTIKYLNFVCVSVTQSYLTLETPWTVAHQAPLSKGFSRQEYWRGLPFPSPGDLPNPGIEPTFPTLQVDSLLSEPPGKSPQFLDILKIQLSLERKLRHIDPPIPGLYLPVQGLAYTLPLSTPSGMSCT